MFRFICDGIEFEWRKKHIHKEPAHNVINIFKQKWHQKHKLKMIAKNS